MIFFLCIIGAFFFIQGIISYILWMTGDKTNAIAKTFYLEMGTAGLFFLAGGAWA